MAIETPHFSFPFRVSATGTKVRVVEQDTDDEIMDCVEVVISTEPGERLDLPDFGVPDQTFQQGGVDMQVVINSIRRNEPRANIDVEAQRIADLTQEVSIRYGRRS
jgi:phage baseplate assembly protein W